MSASPLPVSTPASNNQPAVHQGPLDLKLIIEWLARDGIISPAEAQRTIARCARAESRQAPLVRWPPWP